ncbi:LysR family glycine cleavage system transcriptional activator [Pseudacidovorax sp. 1753]|uniref:transcriptional regulator GcvA n=1 Tax=Pseudacidovorax sp. 1753 TaxID=3156419 RepID=UPI0033986821
MHPLPPLNPLKAFEAAGRLQSVSRAADELAVTPAAVSRQIRTLEEFLAVSLFERVPGGVRLTPAGARYLAEVGPLLAALREATNVVMGGSYRRRVLKIRSPATFAVRWLIPRLAGFHSRHPSIDVQVATSSAPLDFERETIDAGIQLGDGDWAGLRTERLMPNVLVPVVSPGYAATHALQAPRDLAHQTLLHSMARPDDWARWLKAAGAADVNPYRGMKYETSLLAYQAALEGHGVAIAQQALVEKELACGALVTAFDHALDCGAFTYYFAVPAARSESTALRAFRTWLAEALED